MKSRIESWLKLWAPPPDLTGSQWMDRYRRLSSESSAEPGQWTCYPFQRAILDAVTDSRVRMLVIKSSTQMIKTEAIMCAVGYYSHMDPGPIMVVQPRGDDAKAFSKERIAPMIRDTPVLREIFSEGKSRVSDNTIDMKLFRGGMLVITSAGSAANAARRAIRVLCCDEVNKYVDTSEGKAISNFIKRLATFRNRSKIILTCSPTIEDSEIERAFETSDKRERFLPCPHCGHMQSLMGKFYTQVRWDTTLTTRKAQAKSAHYHCEQCNEPWTQAQIQRADESGEWRATRPFEGVAGFWIGEYYSPWKTIPNMVEDFLNKKENPIDLQTFVNTSLAENWVEKGEAPEWEILLSRREEYAPGTVPAGSLFLTAGVDVQRDRVEVEVVAWGRGKESWSVDYQILEGKTSEPEVWKNLAAYLSQTFTGVNGTQYPIARTFVDSGDGTTTNDVYNWVRTQTYSRVQAIKGRDRALLPVGQPSPVDVTYGGKKIKHGLKIRIIDTSFFKSEFYAFLKLRPPTDEERANGLSYPPSYCHFPNGGNYGDEHFKQIASEQLLPHRNRKTGRVKPEWQQTRARNEALDTRIYARAAAWDMGLDRMQERHFKDYEAQLVKFAPIQKQTEPAPAQQGPVIQREGGYLGDRAREWFRR